MPCIVIVAHQCSILPSPTPSYYASALSPSFETSSHLPSGRARSSFVSDGYHSLHRALDFIRLPIPPAEPRSLVTNEPLRRIADVCPTGPHAVAFSQVESRSRAASTLRCWTSMLSSPDPSHTTQVCRAVCRTQSSSAPVVPHTVEIRLLLPHAVEFRSCRPAGSPCIAPVVSVVERHSALPSSIMSRCLPWFEPPFLADGCG